MKCAICFFENEPPILDKVLLKVNNNPELPNFKRSTLHTLLIDMGLQFVKRFTVNMITDRDDITLWRRRYLRRIRQYRSKNKMICYLGESWVNEGNCISKAWVDTTLGNKKQTFLSGKSRGLWNPTSKEKRLIILYIGSDSGFVEDGALVF